MSRIPVRGGALSEAALEIAQMFRDSEATAYLFDRLAYPSFIIGLLCALILARGSRQRPAYAPLALAMLVLTLFPIQNRYHNMTGPLGDWLLFYPTSLILSIGPLLWLYFRREFMPSIRWKPADGLRFLPALLMFSFYLFLALTLAIRKQCILFYNPFSVLVKVEQILAVGLGLGYLCSAWILFLKPVWGRSGQGRESKRVFLSFLTVLTIWAGFLFFDLVFFGLTLTPANYHPLYLVLAVFFYGQGLRQMWLARLPAAGKTVAGDETAMLPVVARLTRLMEEERTFLDPSLTLDKLAVMLGITPRYLSDVVNGGMGCGFYELINHYRIEEAKRRLVDPNNDHLTILGIAMDSGFSSKSQFHNVFKKRLAMTPTQFRQEKRSLPETDANPPSVEESE